MDERFEKLTDQVAALMHELKIPGVAVGVLHDGAGTTAGRGVTSIENPLEVNDTTLFQIGSISKTFTATLAMRLVEQGKLDLDAPVRTYLPDLKLQDDAAAARVSLRHLFTHRGGWEGDHFADFGFGDDALARYVASLAELPQVLPFDRTFSYNNAGFCLAGRIIEVVSGQTFEGALADLVLNPLGMTNTFIFPTDVITRRFAVGHLVKDDQPTVLRQWYIGRQTGAAGGIVSSASDLLRYARFQLGDGIAPDGTRLLAAATLARMQTPLAEWSNESSVGIAWNLREIGGERIVSHGGATNGQLAQLSIVPGRAFALVVLTNGDRGGRLNAQIERYALASYLGLVEPEVTALDLSTAELAPYAGRYARAMAEYVLAPREGGLTLEIIPKGGFPTKDSPPPPAPPPIRLAFYAPDRVIGLDPPFEDARAEFLRDEHGQLRWFRIGQRATARVE